MHSQEQPLLSNGGGQKTKPRNYRGKKQPKRPPRPRPPGSPPLRAGDRATELEVTLDHMMVHVEAADTLEEAAEILNLEPRTIVRRMERYHLRYTKHPRGTPPEERRSLTEPDFSASSTDD